MSNRLPSTAHYMEIFSGRSTHAIIKPVEPFNLQNKSIPYWTAQFRGIPNEIVRSALFCAKNRNKPRQYLKQAYVQVIGGGMIRFTGEELRQDDQLVWLQLLHLARNHQLGNTIRFTPYSFCKSLRWSTSGRSYIRLRVILSRMQATSLSIYSTRLKEGVSLSMIPYFKWSDDLGNSLREYEVRVATELFILFGQIYYTRIQWDQRLALPDGLATWLHAYYASHSAPFPLKISTIKNGAGLTTTSKSSLRQNIEIALNHLVFVNFLASWEIIGELVHVQRK